MSHHVISMVVDSYHDLAYAAEATRGGDVIVYHGKFARYGVLTKPRGYDFSAALAITRSF